MDIITAITAGTNALSVLKTVLEIDKNLDAATWKAKVAELMGAVADMKITLIEAQETISKLQAENQGLADQVRFKAEKTVKQSGWTYEVFEDGQISEFPFCQNCSVDGRLIRVVRGGSRGCSCPRCKNDYDSRTLLYKRPTGTSAE